MECLDHQYRPAVAVNSFTIPGAKSESKEREEIVLENYQKLKVINGFLVTACLFLVHLYLLDNNQDVYWNQFWLCIAK